MKRGKEGKILPEWFLLQGGGACIQNIASTAQVQCIHIIERVLYIIAHVLCVLLNRYSVYYCTGTMYCISLAKMRLEQAGFAGMPPQPLKAGVLLPCTSTIRRPLLPALF